VAGAKLASKQTCQIYLRHDENMECTLVSKLISNYEKDYDKKHTVQQITIYLHC